jgi:hypothetical protein
MNNQYHDIIHSLQQLKTVVPDDAFRRRMIGTIEAFAEPATQPALFLPLLRFALILLTLLAVGGTGVVVASINTKPGDFLYPVKQTVEQVKNNVFAQPTPTPTPAPAKTSMQPVTPTPEVQQLVPTTAPRIPNPTATPTPPLQITNSPTPEPTQVPQSVTASVTTPVLSLETSVELDQLPSLTNAGSKDNDRNGAAESLLPEIPVDITVKTPLLKIGL